MFSTNGQSSRTEGPSDAKLPLPAFLKVLTGNGVPAAKSMAVADKIYKTYNTPGMLAELTDFKLKSTGVDDKEDRKLVLAAIRKAGYKSKPQRKPLRAETAEALAASGSSAGTSTSHADVPLSAKDSTPESKGKATPKRKRKRQEEGNEFLPDRSAEELEEQTYGSLEFNEVLDEEVLKTKFVVVNRAPIMTAWSFMVAERLGFQREEALSIASVYTEMNAISKGVAIGMYDESKKDGVEASKGGSQPYVDLMGRSPLYQTAKSTWLALSSGKPVSPASSYSYITRALRQTAPFVIGAMRVLAESYTPEELNKHGFQLYAEFRPDVPGWGAKGEVRCAKILEQRKKKTVKKEGIEESNSGETQRSDEFVKYEHDSGNGGQEPSNTGESAPKKLKAEHESMTLEEYEAMLDADDTFDDVDLSSFAEPSDAQIGQDT